MKNVKAIAGEEAMMLHCLFVMDIYSLKETLAQAKNEGKYNEHLVTESKNKH